MCNSRKSTGEIKNIKMGEFHLGVQMVRHLGGAAPTQSTMLIGYRSEHTKMEAQIGMLGGGLKVKHRHAP